MFSQMTPAFWLVLIIAAVALDWIIGDPRWIPQPVVIIGNLVSFLTDVLNRGKHRVFKGLLMWFIVIILTGAAVIVVQYFAHYLNFWLYVMVNVWLLASCIAYKSLKQGVEKPAEALKSGDLGAAQKYTGWLVGRQTEGLSEDGIVRAVVETTAENAVDGIIAPLLYMLLGVVLSIWFPVLNPLLLAMIYKAVNTMDSMVGYIYEPYTDFGRCAAKIDDFFNWLPARIGSWFMLAAGRLLGYDTERGRKIYRRDRRNHKSPNSGHPESVVAGLLGVQLGGTNVYFGHVMKKPTIGDAVYPLSVKDITDTVGITAVSELMLMIAACVIAAGVYSIYFIAR